MAMDEHLEAGGAEQLQAAFGEPRVLEAAARERYRGGAHLVARAAAGGEDDLRQGFVEARGDDGARLAGAGDGAHRRAQIDGERRRDVDVDVERIGVGGAVGEPSSGAEGVSVEAATRAACGETVGGVSQPATAFLPKKIRAAMPIRTTR